MMHRELDLGREKVARLKSLHQNQSISTAELQEQEVALLEQMRAETVGPTHTERGRGGSFQSREGIARSRA